MSEQRRPSEVRYSLAPEKENYEQAARRISQQPRLSEAKPRRISQSMHQRVSYSVLDRRMSRFSRASFAGSHRPSTDVSIDRTKYENTYRLEPKEGERFNATTVETIVTQVLQAFLDGETYDARKCSQMALQMSDVIKARVKTLQLPRYKIVCTVVIGQSGGQSVCCGSRCVWDPATDGHASASYKNNSLFATATVFAAYCE